MTFAICNNNTTYNSDIIIIYEHFCATVVAVVECMQPGYFFCLFCFVSILRIFSGFVSSRVAHLTSHVVCSGDAKALSCKTKSKVFL